VSELAGLLPPGSRSEAARWQADAPTKHKPVSTIAIPSLRNAVTSPRESCLNPKSKGCAAIGPLSWGASPRRQPRIEPGDRQSCRVATTDRPRSCRRPLAERTPWRWASIPSCGKSPGPMPEALSALVAFVAEHQRYGDLDSGKDSGYVWLACPCGARIAHPASTPPPTQARTAP